MPDGRHIATRGNSLLVISVVLLIITNGVSTARLATRGIKKQLGTDDYILGLAIVALNVQTAFVFCTIKYGFGKHGMDLTTASRNKALMYFYLVQIMYKVVGGFTKAAFVCLYLRVFARPRFQWFAKWIVMTTIILGTVAFTLATIFQCQPIEFAWNKTLHGTCTSNAAFWYSHAAYHTFLDLVIFTMPIPLVWKLQMPLQKRIGLIALFILGFFGCIASMIRMSALKSSSKTHDPTWGSYNALIWTIVEANVSLICTCLPPLRGPVIHAFRRARGQQGTSVDYHDYNLRELSASRRRGKSTLDEAAIGDWHNQMDKDTYAMRVKESQTRSNSEESIVPHTVPGIIKTTHWEIQDSEHSNIDEMPAPEQVHYRV